MNSLRAYQTVRQNFIEKTCCIACPMVKILHFWRFYWEITMQNGASPYQTDGSQFKDICQLYYDILNESGYQINDEVLTELVCIINSTPFDKLHLQEKISLPGVKSRKNLFITLIFMALKGAHSPLNALLNKNDFKHVDFNEILWDLTLAAVNENQHQLLNKLIKKSDCTQLNWNTHHSYGVLGDISTFWLLCLLATKQDAEPLTHVLTHANINTLELNSGNDHASSLWMIAKIAVDGDPRPLAIILAQKDKLKLNLEDKPKNGPHKDKSVRTLIIEAANKNSEIARLFPEAKFKSTPVRSDANPARSAPAPTPRAAVTVARAVAPLPPPPLPKPPYLSAALFGIYLCAALLSYHYTWPIALTYALGSALISFCGLKWRNDKGYQKLIKLPTDKQTLPSPQKEVFNDGLKASHSYLLYYKSYFSLRDWRDPFTYQAGIQAGHAPHRPRSGS